MIGIVEAACHHWTAPVLWGETLTPFGLMARRPVEEALPAGGVDVELVRRNRSRSDSGGVRIRTRVCPAIRRAVLRQSPAREAGSGGRSGIQTGGCGEGPPPRV